MIGDEQNLFETLGDVMQLKEQYDDLKIEQFIQSIPVRQIEDISKWLKNYSN